MPILRQSHLGRNSGGQLCLQKPQQAHAAKSVEPNNISILPDEILSEILSYILPETRDYHSTFVKDKENFPLTLVCKKWQRIYELTLFRTITTHHSNTTKLSRLRAILSLLNTRPHLRGYPRNLYISMHRTPAHAAICRILAAIIGCCTGLRAVSFYAEYTPEATETLLTISTLPRLEYLDLGGSSLQLFFENFALPSLKSLALFRYGGRNSEHYTGPSREEPLPITQACLEHLFPPSKYHTGNVTRMSFDEPSCHPNVTEHILRWPSALTDLSIRLLQSVAGKYYKAEAIQRILDIHRSSLKHVTIGILWGSLIRRVGSPDFSSFSCLETLSISAYNLIRSETPIDAARKLSAPNLRSLTLSFRTEDQDGPSPCDFGKDQVSWMKEFAEVKKGKYPGSRWQKLVVDPFSAGEDPRHLRERLVPEHPAYIPFEERAEQLAWPWENLEEAKQCAKEFDLRVEYEARYTREEWDRIILGLKVERPDVLEDLQPGLDALFL